MYYLCTIFCELVHVSANFFFVKVLAALKFKLESLSSVVFFSIVIFASLFDCTLPTSRAQFSNVSLQNQVKLFCQYS